MIYRELFGLEIRPVIKKLHLYQANRNKHIKDHMIMYQYKLVKWYPVLSFDQAEWILEHYMNKGFAYLNDDDYYMSLKFFEEEV